MAHKKGQGSVRNGRDSLPKRRGLKAYGGQAVQVGSILVTQCGTRYAPGRFVRMSKNCNIHSLVVGTVYFDQGGKSINVKPANEAETAIG